MRINIFRSVLNMSPLFLLAFLMPVITYGDLSIAINNSTIGRYQLAELTISYPDTGFSNIWEDVQASAVFVSPSGKHITVGGFYHSPDTWKIRFTPSEIGAYTWTVTLLALKVTSSAIGSFTCAASGEHGFVRRHPKNPFRLVFEDGTLFPAFGVGSCFLDIDSSGSPFDRDWGLDGGDRSKGGSERFVSLEAYLRAMADTAGFNIYRWSVNNCTIDNWESITPSGNTYLMKEGLWGDTLCFQMRKHNIRLYMDIMGWRPVYADSSADAARMAAVKRYVKYAVDRWGALVDIWELCNESTPPDAWVMIVAQYLKSIDPYGHLVSISWDRGAQPDIDITSPHWYEKESELESDTRTVAKIEEYRSYQKPIIFGEQGNGIANWDSLSGLRARIRSWTAFFNEGHFIFWESNFAKDYKATVAANIYIGPQERAFFRALQNFTRNVSADAVVSKSAFISSAVPVRSYELTSHGAMHLYIRNSRSITESTANVKLSFSFSTEGTAKWLNTLNGGVLRTDTVSQGNNEITAPDFTTDIALDVRSSNSTGVKRGIRPRPDRHASNRSIFLDKNTVSYGIDGRTVHSSSNTFRKFRTGIYIVKSTMMTGPGSSLRKVCVISP